MRRRIQIARRADWTLTRVEFVGISGQVCSTRFELSGPETLIFSTSREAQAALAARAAEPAAA